LMPPLTGPDAAKTGPNYNGVGSPWTAPTPIRGVSGVISRDTETEKTYEEVIKKSEDVLKTIGKGVIQRLRKDPDKRFRDVLQESIKDAVREEGMKALKEGEELVLEKIPFAKAVRLTFEISRQFADGVGKALDKINVKLNEIYDVSQLSPDEI